VQSLRTGEQNPIRTGSDAQLLPTGHLVYAAGSTLFAMGVDVSTLEPTGGPISIIEGIRRTNAGPGSTVTADYDVSREGVLVYVPGESQPPVPRQLVTVDRNGNAEPGSPSHSQDSQAPTYGPAASIQDYCAAFRIDALTAAGTSMATKRSAENK
jgi:hypothetical protein